MVSKRIVLTFPHKLVDKPIVYKLVKEFEIIDYTTKVIDNPDRFFLTDKVQKGSLKQKAILLFLRLAYWLCPAYIWLLRKAKA